MRGMSNKNTKIENQIGHEIPNAIKILPIAFENICN
jgi:hypothetical protein